MLAPEVCKALLLKIIKYHLSRNFRSFLLISSFNWDDYIDIDDKYKVEQFEFGPDEDEKGNEEKLAAAAAKEVGDRIENTEVEGAVAVEEVETNETQSSERVATLPQEGAINNTVEAPLSDDRTLVLQDDRNVDIDK